MNISELKTCLPALLKNNIVPFIWGKQGMGKTQVIKQFAKERGMGFVHLHLATQEVGDLVGLLVHGEKGEVQHARPSWFPTEGSGIIFLDELNRAHPDVLQAIFSLMTEKTIHTHKLPCGWGIVAAGNYTSSAFNVTDMGDSAFTSRFCHLDFTPSVEEFLGFIDEKHTDSAVSSFIYDHRSLLEEKVEGKLPTITPDRRKWGDMISKLEQEQIPDQIRFEVYSGILGQTTAASFITWKSSQSSSIRGRDVLHNYKKVRERVLNCVSLKESRLDILGAAADEALEIMQTTLKKGPNEMLSEEALTNFKQFMLDIPKELGLKVVKKLSKMKFPQLSASILDNKEFSDQFVSDKRRGL